MDQWTQIVEEIFDGKTDTYCKTARNPNGEKEANSVASFLYSKERKQLCRLNESDKDSDLLDIYFIFSLIY